MLYRKKSMQRPASQHGVVNYAVASLQTPVKSSACAQMAPGVVSQISPVSRAFGNAFKRDVQVSQAMRLAHQVRMQCNSHHQ